MSETPEAFDLGRPACRWWRAGGEIRGLFDGPPDPEWEADRDRLDHDLNDRWDQLHQYLREAAVRPGGPRPTRT